MVGRAAKVSGRAMLVAALLVPVVTLTAGALTAAAPAQALAAASPAGLSSSYTMSDLGAGVPDAAFDTAGAWVNRAGGFVVYDRIDGSTPVAVRYNINTGITTVLPSGFFAVGVTDTGEVAGDRAGAAAWWSSGVEHPVAGAAGRPVDLSSHSPSLLAVNGGGLAAGHGRADCYNSDDSVGTCAPSDMPVTSSGGADAVPSSQTPCANPSFVYCTALQVTSTIGAGVNDLNEVVGVDTSNNIATWTGTGAPAAVPGLVGFRGQVMAFNKNDDMIVHKNSPPGYYFYSVTSGVVPIQGTLGGLTGGAGQFISEGLNDAGVVVGLASLTDSRGNPVHKAFGWTADNGPVDLQPLVTNLGAAGFADLGTPVAIDDLGDIVGYASKSDGSHFYLLRPDQPRPTVTSVDPAFGPPAGGTAITIHGTGLTDATSVTFRVVGGTTSAVGANVACTTDVVCTATTPDVTSLIPQGGDSVDTDVIVSGPGGSSQASPADIYQFVSGPVVTGVSPGQGPLTGSTIVIVTGSGFFNQGTSDVTQVTFVPPGGSEIPAALANATSDTSLTVTSPDVTSRLAAGQTSLLTDVVVTTSSGASLRGAADRFVFAELAVTRVDPSVGPVNGGTTITVSGSGFMNDQGEPTITSVHFNPVSGAAPLAAASFVVVNPTTLTASTPDATRFIPNGARGLATDIRVSTASDQSTAIPPGDLFTFGLPRITAISSTRVPLGTPTPIRIFGTGFTGVKTIRIVLPGEHVVIYPSSGFVVLSDQMIDFVTIDLSNDVLTNRRSYGSDLTVSLSDNPDNLASNAAHITFTR